MCASMAAMNSMAITAWITVQNCSSVTLAGRYGNSMYKPDRDISVPPMITIQKIPFWPALKRFAGGWLPFDTMPPPCFSHCQSIFPGMLSLIQIRNMIRTPSMNGNAR